MTSMHCVIETLLVAQARGSQEDSAKQPLTEGRGSDAMNYGSFQDSLEATGRTEDLTKARQDKFQFPASLPVLNFTTCPASDSEETFVCPSAPEDNASGLPLDIAESDLETAQQFQASRTMGLASSLSTDKPVYQRSFGSNRSLKSISSVDNRIEEELSNFMSTAVLLDRC